ncbi:MAG: TFIIB-type zinc ribbon-containing protein [Halobacteriaceae archaeon]
MEIRGRRECQSCGTRWSYYDTGAVTCPDCGSPHSVGLEDERRLHTATAGSLDLSAAREAAAADRFAEAARLAEDAARSFVRDHGFVDGGVLQPLDDRFVATQELCFAAALLAGGRTPSDAERRYLLALLSGAAEGERPPAEAVPAGAHSARGLAAAAAVAAYRRDLLRWRDATDADLPPAATRLLGRLADHRKRVDALDGAVPPADADALVAAARALGASLLALDAGGGTADAGAGDGPADGVPEVDREHLEAARASLERFEP